MKKRILLHDCRIESSSFEGDSLLINFSKILVVNVKSEFGFNLDLNDSDYYSGSIKIQNFVTDTPVLPCEVFDGYVQLPDYKYDLLPLDLSVNRSVLVLETSEGDFSIVGDSLKVLLGPIC